MNVLGTASNAATVTLWGDNGAFSSTTRKGDYYRGELRATNSSTALWLGVTNLAVLNNGSNPDLMTNATGKTFIPRTPETFYYDWDGNLTNDGRWTYTWDAENRLIRMVANTAVGPQQRIDFDYDWRGRRTSKRVWNNTAGSGLPSIALTFLYDEWNLLAELAPLAGNALVRSYAWGLDLSGTQQGAGGVGGLLLSRLASASQTNYCTYDGNGNVANLINAANGSISATYEYGPFGELIRATGAIAKDNPIRFSTKYQDEETDLIYYGYRYYSVPYGRWLSRDPMGEQGGVNLYVAVDNDLLSNTDGFGLEKCGPKVTFPIRYDFKMNPPSIPSVPGMNLTVESKGRAEIDVTVQNCDICCKNGRPGTRTTTEVKGFVRGGMTVTWGGVGKYDLGDNWNVSYWYGIRGEISMQVQVNATVSHDTCGTASSPDICFGYRALGRLSGGGQARLVLGRWGVKVLEATVNGELTQDGRICLKNCGSAGGL